MHAHVCAKEDEQKEVHFSNSILSQLF